MSRTSSESVKRITRQKSEVRVGRRTSEGENCFMATSGCREHRCREADSRAGALRGGVMFGAIRRWSVLVLGLSAMMLFVAACGGGSGDSGAPDDSTTSSSQASSHTGDRKVDVCSLASTAEAEVWLGPGGCVGNGGRTVRPVPRGLHVQERRRVNAGPRAGIRRRKILCSA